MKFPSIAYNKSVYISEEGNTRLGVALHPGRPMEYINGQSPSGRTWNIYHIKNLCQQARDCEAVLEYRPLEEGEYYTIDNLVEGNFAVGGSEESPDITVLENKLRQAQQGDLNLDGMVNIADFLIFVENFGKSTF